MNTSEMFRQMRGEYDQKKSSRLGQILLDKEKMELDKKLGELAYSDTSDLQMAAVAVMSQAVKEG